QIIAGAAAAQVVMRDAMRHRLEELRELYEDLGEGVAEGEERLRDTIESQFRETASVLGSLAASSFGTSEHVEQARQMMVFLERQVEILRELPQTTDVTRRLLDAGQALKQLREAFAENTEEQERAI